MLSDLVDLSRLQLGQPLDLQRRMVNLVSLVDGVVWAHQLATEHHQIQLTSPVDELVGEWDPVRIEHVIANLLDNAVKYSPRGGKITVSVRPEESAGREGTAVEVGDQGIGIPADDLPRIFERFHRGTNVTGHYAGSGVGLAIARQVVGQHGGAISVASVEGQGTTFTVWLPLAPPPETGK
jgi:signal transduction histidine kinase